MIIYRLYTKQPTGEYTGPKLFKDLEEAISHAKGEYIIIKNENNTDTIVKYKNKYKFGKEEELDR